MNELEKIATLNSVEMFKPGGIQKIIDSVRAEVQGIVPDTSTVKGRKEIASLAHKVAKSKTLLDKMGKSLADSLNAQLKPINAERKLARDELDKIRDEIRAPLSKWEAEEKAREAAEAERVAAELLADELEQAHEIGLLMNEKITRDREEAKRLADEQWAALKEAARVAADKAQAERDERIKEAARLEAERKVENERLSLIRKEENAKREKIAAEEREKQAVEAAKQAEVQAKRDAEIAAQRAEEDKQEAIKREQEKADRERIELAQRNEFKKQRQQEISDAAKRNEENVANKCREAGASIMLLGVDEVTARKIVIAIHQGKIKNVSIQY